MDDPAWYNPITPSDALKLGYCPSCLGRGIVFKIIDDREGDCSTCEGTGRFPPVAESADPS